MSNLFEEATRRKYRFPFKGVCTAEDLWDLDLKSLDSIFKTLNAQAKQSKEESLLEVKSKEDQILDDKIAIVRYVVAYKQAEMKNKTEAMVKRAEAEKIRTILAKKNDQDLESKSAEELQKMLDELEK